MKSMTLALLSVICLFSIPVRALVEPVTVNSSLPAWTADIQVVTGSVAQTADFCRGALIASQWILSTGNCFADALHVLDDVSATPVFVARIGPNRDLVGIDDYFRSDDLRLALFRLASPSEAKPLPVSSKTASELLNAKVTILGRQKSLPIYNSFYAPEVSGADGTCRIAGQPLASSITGAYCYLFTKLTNTNFLYQTAATVIDPAAVGSPNTALDKQVVVDKTGKQLYLDFRTSKSYPCYEDMGAPILGASAMDGQELVGVVAGVGMTAGLQICGMSIANVFVSPPEINTFVDRTIADYELTSRCPAAPELEVTFISGSREVALHWETVPNATGYKLHYTAGYGRVPIATIDMQSRTGIYTQVESGVEYLVAVTAYNGDCSSELSDPAPVNLERH